MNCGSNGGRKAEDIDDNQDIATLYRASGSLPSPVKVTPAGFRSG
jgi:hypothetical protein